MAGDLSRADPNASHIKSGLYNFFKREENKMEIKGHPFWKYAYGDRKSKRNRLEVAACHIAASRLGIQHYVVNSIGHNYWIDVWAKSEKRKEELQTRILEEVKNVSRKKAERYVTLYL